jgi:putative tryptophan/tyrosine transport system substrate-binding protein
MRKGLAKLASAAIVLAFAVIAAISATPRAEARWSVNPTVTIAAPAGDNRMPAVVEALEFWNRQLADLGSTLRLGPVTHTTGELPMEYLQRVSVAVLRREPHPDVPDLVRAIPGQIIVALSEGEFVSFAASLGSPGRVLIGIRSVRDPSLAQPNIARNLIAHELGHALGLSHNGDATKLMCGRPASCRPQDFAASTARFFPLTDEDKKILARLYPRHSGEAHDKGKVHRVGLLSSGREFLTFSSRFVDVFTRTLADLGYVEGRNITFVYRWSENRLDSIQALATELVALKVDVLVASDTRAIEALRDATTTIPIVANSVGDPIESRLVSSLSRPGGNTTGITGRLQEMHQKWLELVKAGTPKVSRVAIMALPHAIEIHRREMEAAASALAVRLHFITVASPREIEAAFDAAVKAGAHAVVMLPALHFARNPKRVADLALHHRLPSIFWREDYAEAGGLIAYGPDRDHLWRRTAGLVGKILGGARPTDLPFEQADRFRLVVNLKTAKALGLTIPQSLLVRADKIIQ